MKLIHNPRNWPVTTIFTSIELSVGAEVKVKKINNIDEKTFETFICYIHQYNRKSITFQLALAGKFHYLTYNWKDFLEVEK